MEIIQHGNDPLSVVLLEWQSCASVGMQCIIQANDVGCRSIFIFFPDAQITKKKKKKKK